MHRRHRFLSTGKRRHRHITTEYSAFGSRFWQWQLQATWYEDRTLRPWKPTHQQVSSCSSPRPWVTIVLCRQRRFALSQERARSRFSWSSARFSVTCRRRFVIHTGLILVNADSPSPLLHVCRSVCTNFRFSENPYTLVQGRDRDKRGSARRIGGATRIEETAMRNKNG